MLVKKCSRAGKHADTDFLERLREILLVGLLNNGPDVGHNMPGIDHAAERSLKAKMIEVNDFAAQVAGSNERFAGNTGACQNRMTMI